MSTRHRRVIWYFPNVIASVGFRNFKALRNTSVQLAPFNLVIGPNGSGKTSLIQALQRLRDLAKLPAGELEEKASHAEALELSFQFSPPHADVQVRLACSNDLICDTLRVKSPHTEQWSALRKDILRLRSFVLDHEAMVQGSSDENGYQLSSDGSNLAAVLSRWKTAHASEFNQIETEFCRMLPEFSRLETRALENGKMQFQAVLQNGKPVQPENLSQGTLYALAMLTLAGDPSPPSMVCIEEIDRGVHPRMLREIRDTLYHLAYPNSFGLKRNPVQVVATTHSPYLLDLFRDHPEEVIIAQKEGQEARFERLADRADLKELLQEGGSLGDMWFTGILGGVPEESYSEGDE